MERLLRSRLTCGRFEGLTATLSRRMSAVRGTHNKTTELILRMAMVRGGVKGWVLHRKMLGRPDFFFPKKMLAVFVDGCFWHGCKKCGHIPRQNNAYWVTKLKRNRQRDTLINRNLRLTGITVLRFWEHELKNNPATCVARIRLVLSSHTPRSKKAVTAAANQRSSFSEKPF
jgi:DNA mismatch endonuclease (patch repair protein)